MPLKEERLNDVTQEQVASNWLTTYAWDIKNMPTTCSCGAKLDYQHCMSCKKGGFITMRHNDVRDLTANILKGVLNDLEVEPQLLPLKGENLKMPNCDKG